jgi:hypothetical protein
MRHLKNSPAAKRAAIRARNTRSNNVDAPSTVLSAVVSAEGRSGVRRGLVIESIDIEVSGHIDPRAGKSDLENIPVPAHDTSYAVHLASPARRPQIDALLKAVQRSCDSIDLPHYPQPIRATVLHTRTGTQGDSHGRAA